MGIGLETPLYLRNADNIPYQPGRWNEEAHISLFLALNNEETTKWGPEAIPAFFFLPLQNIRSLSSVRAFIAISFLFSLCLHGPHVSSELALSLLTYA